MISPVLCFSAREEHLLLHVVPGKDLLIVRVSRVRRVGVGPIHQVREVPEFPKLGVNPPQDVHGEFGTQHNSCTNGVVD